MIVRIWKGRTSRQSEKGYLGFVENEVFSQFRKIPGFLGARLLKREDVEDCLFVMHSYWDSMEAVRAFAGPEPSKAVIPARARAFLSSYDEVVDHFEVVLDSPIADGNRSTEFPDTAGPRGDPNHPSPGSA